MNVLNIETFLTIVETLSLSEASKKLFVSQSTISTRLNTLERELNTILLKREAGKKFIELTPQGEEFIIIAKRWMSLKKDTIMWMNKKPTLRLNLGSIDSLNIYVLPSLFADITNNKASTSLSINVSSHSSVQVFKQLETYDIDIGLVSRLIRSNSLLSEPIFSERMVLVSSSIFSSYGATIHPEELDVKKELYLDWGPNFQIWHDYWWDPTETIKLTVDTAGLIMKCINIPRSWSMVPISVAQSFEITEFIKISEIIIPPDDRIYYKIIHRYPKASSIKPIEIFEEYLENFIRDHPSINEIK